MNNQPKNQNLQEIRKKVKIQLFNSVNRERFIPPAETKRSKSIQQSELKIKTQIKQSTTARFRDIYKMLKLIGTGAHGVVKICQKLQDTLKVNYAVKKLSCQNDPELIRTIIQTFNINRTLNDIPKVIKAQDLFIDENEQVAYWVMEYCDYKTLQNYIRKSIPDITIQIIMKQLAQTLAIIHSRGVCHRDLKPDNILVKIHGLVDIKIIDFGVSKKFMVKRKNNSIYHEMWTRTGAPLYQAPETFLGGGYDEKVDVWSIGVILYQLLCGQFPFYSDSHLDTIELITDMDNNIDKKKEFQALNYLQKDLLRRMLNKIPEKRLSAEEIVLHPWINQVSTEKRKSEDDLQANRSTYDITTSVNLGSHSIRIDFNNHIHYTQKDMQDLALRIKDCVIEDSHSRKSSYQFPSAHTSYDVSPINQVDESQQFKFKK